MIKEMGKELIEWFKRKDATVPSSTERVDKQK